MFRKTLFWLHLVTGLAVGLVVGVMSFTGAALAFERDLVAWTESDARLVTPPAGNPARLTLDQLVGRVRAMHPEGAIASITVSAGPADAVAIALPRNVTLYANPYTGELREPPVTRLRTFLRTMIAWHVRLNAKPGPDNLGATIASACTVAAVFLGLSGLVLWWPRAATSRVLRPSLWFVRGATGRARDWNWHNVVGFWTLPCFLIMTVSGVVLSYRWANNLVFRIAGETPPSQTAPARPVTTAVAARPAPILGLDAVFAVVQQQTTTAWDQISFRFAPALPLSPNAGGDRSASSTYTVTIRDKNPWPVFVKTTLTLDSRTGEVRRRETPADMSPGTRARSWLRLLHTGEAFRWPGQIVAGVACLGACLLVWTGFALAWRRFFSRNSSAAATPAEGNAP